MDWHNAPVVTPVLEFRVLGSRAWGRRDLGVRISGA